MRSMPSCGVFALCSDCPQCEKVSEVDLIFTALTRHPASLSEAARLLSPLSVLIKTTARGPTSEDDRHPVFIEQLLSLSGKGIRIGYAVLFERLNQSRPALDHQVATGIDLRDRQSLGFGNGVSHSANGPLREWSRPTRITLTLVCDPPPLQALISRAISTETSLLRFIDSTS